MSILLTGSTGYIGSRFLKKISETYPKQEIRLIARRNVKGFKTFKCDFLNDAIPNDALNSVDTVYHIAGRAHDLDNKKLENEYIKINTNSTINLANLAIAHNIKSFILSDGFTLALYFNHIFTLIYPKATSKSIGK